MRLSGRQIDCIRGGRGVFSGLDFETSSGEVLAVVGPNGSGKTSLLRLIAGLLVPAGGSVPMIASDTPSASETFSATTPASEPNPSRWPCTALVMRTSEGSMISR